MFEKVRLRLTVLTVALFVCLYVLSSAAVYGIVRHTVMSNVDQRMMSVASRIDDQVLNNQVPMVPGNGTYWWVPKAIPSTNASNNYVRALGKLLRRHSKGNYWLTTWTAPDGNVYRVVNLPANMNEPGSPEILISQDITQQLSVLTPLFKVIIAVGIVLIAMAGSAGFLWAGRALRPIRRAWNRQVQFVADASHELRTPLAVIQSNLDLVLDHTEQSVEDNLEWIDNAHSEARRLARLVEDLLTLARSDANTAPIRVEPVNLTEVVSHVTDLFEPVAGANDLRLEVDNAADVRLQGDRDRLAQLFVILVDNACKYTDPGGQVSVRLTLQRGTATLQVADTGSGIDDADLPHVFERFYRADKARARSDTAGTGLGLSIAKWITEAHRGKMQLTSKAGEGTVVTVQLPAAPEPQAD